MTKLAEQLKQGADQAWESLWEGWRELSARASGALTRFWHTSADALPPSQPKAPGGSVPRMTGWAFMAADVFDDVDTMRLR